MSVFAVNQYAVTVDYFVLELNVTSYRDIVPDLFHDVIHHVIVTATQDKLDRDRCTFRHNFDALCFAVCHDVGTIIQLDDILSTLHDSVCFVSGFVKVR